MLTGFEAWVDAALTHEIPEEIVACCFNIYEDTDDKWSVELVGCRCFEEGNSDWACDEVTTFGTRAHPYGWEEAAAWETILQEVVELVKCYLNHGSSGTLKKLQAVAVGFVDGDLEIVAQS